VAAAAGKVFNIATGNTVTLNELLEIMCGICGLEFQPVYRDERSGDIRHSAAAIDRARELLEWRPVVTLDDGLGALLQSLGVFV
jgi:nucleoside-diphosphate-sugar epimerase